MARSKKPQSKSKGKPQSKKPQSKKPQSKKPQSKSKGKPGKLQAKQGKKASASGERTTP